MHKPMVRRAKIIPRENCSSVRKVPPVLNALRKWVGVQNTGGTENGKDIIIYHIDVQNRLSAVQWGETNFTKN